MDAFKDKIGIVAIMGASMVALSMGLLGVVLALWSAVAMSGAQEPLRTLRSASSQHDLCESQSDVAPEPPRQSKARWM